MSDKIYTETSILNDGEINFSAFFNVLFAGWRTISSSFVISSVLIVIFSLNLPNIYQSSALLAPSNDQNLAPGNLRNIGGLASIAGINLPSNASIDNTQEALEKMQSLSFFANEIMPEIYLAELLAVNSWDPIKNRTIFDNDIYDEKTNNWVRDVEYPKTQIPSAQESFDVFKNNHLIITEDQITGFIRISIRHQSPYVAKKWVELMITKINAFYRQKDKLEAEIAVSYLNEQIAKTSLAEIKQIMAEIQKQEIQKLTMIEAKESYVFDYIDPPEAMEVKNSPNRAIICILGAFFGTMLGVFIVLLRHFRSIIKK